MTQDSKTYQGGKKSALFKVTAAPKGGGKPVYERIIPADSAAKAKVAEKDAIEKALDKRGMTRSQVVVQAEKVTDIV